MRAGAIAEFWRCEGSGGGLGLRGGRIADDLDPVSELDPLDQFWQLVLAVDPAPTLLGALDKLEDHGERHYPALCLAGPSITMPTGNLSTTTRSPQLTSSQKGSSRWREAEQILRSGPAL